MKRKATLGVLLAIIIWGVLATVASARQGAPGADPASKLAPGLQKKLGEVAPGTFLPLIIQTEGRPDARDHAAVRGAGGRTGQAFGSIDGFPARLPASQVPALARRARIRNISIDWPVSAAVDSAAPYAGAPRVWQDFGLTGAGVTVAVIDSGLNESDDLNGWDASGKVMHVDMRKDSSGRKKRDSIDPVSNDDFGHGTHVAGIVGGNGAGSSGSGTIQTFYGVAPEVDVINLRVLEADGSADTSDVIRAIDWVLNNNRKHEIRVLNLSLGHPVTESYLTDPLCRAVEEAVADGIVVVVAAGNDGSLGYNTILSPANHPWVITVGAAHDQNTLDYGDDLAASFTAMGPTAIDGIIKPDLVASGIQIVATRADGSYLDTTYPETRLPYSSFVSGGDGSDSPYAAYSGTSMAAPVVSGAAALLIAADSNLNPATVKARLMLSAQPIEDEVVRIGAGMLDVRAALDRTDVWRDGDGQSPRVLVDEEGNVVGIDDPLDFYPDPLDSSLDAQIAIWGGGYSTWGQIAIWGGSNSAQIAIWGGNRALALSDSLTATD